MTKSKSQIQDEVFKDFEKSLNVFYRQRQQRYFSKLKEKIEDGDIDPSETSYKNTAWKEAEKFMETRVKELIIFIRNYVDEGIDKIKNQRDNGTINKEEADVRFEVLKYILLAGENEQSKK
jgi:hypothetical protein